MKDKGTVKGKASNSEPSPGSLSGETRVEQAKVEQNCCGRCRWYDISTERAFHRDGIRKGLVETRATCKAPKDHTKASLHLVKRESIRPCFEAGVYVASVKEGKKEQASERQSSEHKEQLAEQKADKTSRAKMKVSVVTNSLNGETKRLETKGPREKVFVKAIA